MIIEYSVSCLARRKVILVPRLFYFFQALKNVFMAVAIDTYDSRSGYPGNLHPRYKQIVAERLATAGLHVAYGREELPANGPFPTSFTVEPGEEDGSQVSDQ